MTRGGPQQARMAQGFAALATLLVGHAMLSQAVTALAPRLARQGALMPVCLAPVAIETAQGMRLGCADEPGLARCEAHPFDALRLSNGRCQRIPNGMPVAWYVSLGYRLNINRAQPEHLQALPHIGAKTAHAIVRYRQIHGPYPSVDALSAVAGVGPGTVGQLRRFVTAADGG